METKKKEIDEGENLTEGEFHNTEVIMLSLSLRGWIWPNGLVSPLGRLVSDKSVLKCKNGVIKKFLNSEMLTCWHDKSWNTEIMTYWHAEMLKSVNAEMLKY